MSHQIVLSGEFETVLYAWIEEFRLRTDFCHVEITHFFVVEMSKMMSNEALGSFSHF